jgi:hypothetical protein
MTQFHDNSRYILILDHIGQADGYDLHSKLRKHVNTYFKHLRDSNYLQSLNLESHYASNMKNNKE